MISFRLDGRSVVPPYLQIVQQVRQALRMGVLDVGDKLPTVREVVAATAVNPNTVLKAYRDLEREGLVEAAGRARHVRAAPAARAAARHACAARPQPGPVGAGSPRGRARRRVDRVAAARHAAGGSRGGDRVTDFQSAARPAIETRGLAKRYRKVTALTDCTITVPEGRISALIGPNGAGKTTLLRLLAGLARPTAGEVAVLGGTPRQDPAFLAEHRLPGPGDPAVPAADRRGPHPHRRAPEPALGRRVGAAAAEDA